jgi:hypothetical protein
MLLGSLSRMFAAPRAIALTARRRAIRRDFPAAFGDGDLLDRQHRAAGAFDLRHQPSLLCFAEGRGLGDFEEPADVVWVDKFFSLLSSRIRRSPSAPLGLDSCNLFYDPAGAQRPQDNPYFPRVPRHPSKASRSSRLLAFGRCGSKRCFPPGLECNAHIVRRRISLDAHVRFISKRFAVFDPRECLAKHNDGGNVVPLDISTV